MFCLHEGLPTTVKVTTLSHKIDYICNSLRPSKVEWNTQPFYQIILQPPSMDLRSIKAKILLFCANMKRESAWWGILEGMDSVVWLFNRMMDRYCGKIYQIHLAAAVVSCLECVMDFQWIFRWIMAVRIRVESALWFGFNMVKVMGLHFVQSHLNGFICKTICIHFERTFSYLNIYKPKTITS